MRKRSNDIFYNDKAVYNDDLYYLGKIEAFGT